MTSANQRLLLQFAGICCLISGLALTAVGGLYVMETIVDGKTWGVRQCLTLVVGLFDVFASIIILTVARSQPRLAFAAQPLLPQSAGCAPSTASSWLPIASCLMALAALALALLSWSVNVESLQPGLALVCLLLTIASFFSAIAGVVHFRHGPRHLAITAWIGLALSALPIAFWILMILIILSINAGNPF